MLSKEEIEFKYGSLPDALNIEKVNTLLNKFTNKHKLVNNLKEVVMGFLQAENIQFEEGVETFLNKDGIEQSINIITIDERLVILLVDSYVIWNKKNLVKGTAEKIHFAFVEKGFRVVWIKKFEWENLNKQNVLKSMILHSINKTKNRFFARNTVCEIVNNSDLKDFFNTSSFYGFRSASVAVCLKDKKTGEILQAMSFGHPYYGKGKYGENCVECIRSAGKPHTLVVGGMTKLMKFFVQNFGHTFDTILYYVDDAHHQNDSMDSLGFTFSHFAGGGVHNVWNKSGAMFMRTPALHKEIMFFQKIGEIYGVPDVGNSVFLFKNNDIADLTVQI
jgi:hypothetical protein